MNDFKGLIALGILALLVTIFSAPWKEWVKKLVLPSPNRLPYGQNPLRILRARYHRRVEFDFHHPELKGKLRRQG